MMMAVTDKLIEWMRNNKDDRLLKNGTHVIKTARARTGDLIKRGAEGVVIGGAHLDDPDLPGEVVRNVVHEFKGAQALYAVSFENDAQLVSLIINTGIKTKK